MIEEISKRVEQLEKDKIPPVEFQKMQEDVKEVKGMVSVSTELSRGNHEQLTTVINQLANLGTIVDGNTQIHVPGIKAQHDEMYNLYNKNPDIWKALSKLDVTQIEAIETIDKDGWNTLKQVIRVWGAFVIIFGLFGFASLSSAIGLILLVKELFHL